MLHLLCQLDDNWKELGFARLNSSVFIEMEALYLPALLIEHSFNPAIKTYCNLS